MNNVGDIVGVARDPDDEDGSYGQSRNVLWHVDLQGNVTGPIDLGTFHALDINDNEIMVGIDEDNLTASIAWFDNQMVLQRQSIGLLNSGDIVSFGVGHQQRRRSRWPSRDSNGNPMVSSGRSPGAWFPWVILEAARVSPRGSTTKGRSSAGHPPKEEIDSHSFGKTERSATSMISVFPNPTGISKLSRASTTRDKSSGWGTLEGVKAKNTDSCLRSYLEVYTQGTRIQNINGFET